MEKMKIYLTDSNTLNQIRPKTTNSGTYRLTGSEIKELFDIIEALQQKGQAVIENKIKRDGISYGLYLATGYWYPPVEKSSEAILDVPYGETSINLAVANTTGLDINDRDNWDKGCFDLQALGVKVEKPDIQDWKIKLFGEDLLAQLL